MCNIRILLKRERVRGLGIRILLIIIKEILEGIRDIKSMILMILMPSILTVILGIALKDSQSLNIDFKGITVLYEVNNNDIYLEKLINGYIKMIQGMDIRCEEKDETYKVTAKDIVLYVDEINNINIKYSKYIKTQGEYIEYALENYMKKSVLYNNSFSSDLVIDNNKENYVTLNSITGDNTSTSLDYYGITMIVITVMFSSVTGAYRIIREKQNGTLMKIKSTTINNMEFLTGKVIGSLIIVLLQIEVSMFISRYMLKVNWGDDIKLVTILLLCEGLASIAVGTFVGIIVEDEKSAWIIMLSGIMVLGFFSGAFVQLGIIKNDLVTFLSNLNLIKYENKALFNLIYNEGSWLSIKVCCIYILISLTMVKLTSKIMEEF